MLTAEVDEKTTSTSPQPLLSTTQLLRNLIKSKQKLRYICIYRFFFVPLRADIIAYCLEGNVI